MKFKTLLCLFLIWQAAIIFVVSWSKSWFPLQNMLLGGGEQATQSDPHPYLTNPELYFRGNFDGIHYINIARRGIGLYEEAFFPLYPNLIRLIFPLFHNNTVFTGSLISTISFLIGLIFLVKIVKLDFDQPVAFWTIVALLAFPTSFFFTSVYTEGLFFCLSVAAFYFARTNRWWLAAVFVAMATYTRLVGVFLIPALFLERFSENKRVYLKSLIPFLIMPLGLLIYMNYLEDLKNDPLAFAHAQEGFAQGRTDKVVLPYQVAFRYVKMLTSISLQNRIYSTLAFESFISLSFIAVGVIMVFKFRSSYALYTLSSLILPTLTGTLTSMPRYALLVFPVFIFLGKYLAKSRILRWIYFTGSLVLAVYFLALFSRGYWVA